MEQETQQVEAEATAAAQAGYDRKTRGTTPPADPVANATSEQPLADKAQEAAPAPAAPAPEPDPQADPAPEPSARTLTTEDVEDLKARVDEIKSKGASAEDVRKLFGEIGNLNRMLKDLKPKEAPADDELAAALKAAEDLADEYPAIAGPLVKTVKALQAKVAALAPSEPEPAAPAAAPTPTPAPSPYSTKQMAAIEILNEAHPDRMAINKSPEFKAWLQSKGTDYEKRFRNSWNAIEVGRTYDEFKAAQAARQKKTERLVAAASAPGVAAPAATTLPDEAGFARGYARGKGKRHF